MARGLALQLRILQRYPDVLVVCRLSLSLNGGLSPYIRYFNEHLAYK